MRSNQNLSHRVLLPLLLTGLFTGLVSCSTAQKVTSEHRAQGASGAPPADAEPGTDSPRSDAPGVGASDGEASKPQAFFHPLEHADDFEDRTQRSETLLEEMEMLDAKPNLEEVTLEELYNEVSKRVLAQWVVFASKATAPTPGDTANRVLALALLLDASDSEFTLSETALEEALQVSSQSKAPTPSRLLAAAVIAAKGRKNWMQVVEGISPQEKRRRRVTAEPDEPQDGQGGAFAIRSLSFARSVKGAGDFTSLPATRVESGRPVLIYGEFFNYQTAAAKVRSAGYHCSFSASLQLVDESGTVKDTLEFLLAGEGEQRVKQRNTLVNFWAKYDVPAELPHGRYRIIVKATDILAGREARETLEFEVPK